MSARRRIEVCLEIGKKKAFASALAWPGLCRSGKDEDGALEALVTYGERYRPVPERAGLRFSVPALDDLVVVERCPGSATTDFGAPGAIATAERAPLSAAAARRQAAVVEACWGVLDDVTSGAPASLRTGRRGGGRRRDAIVAHVIEAERAYARKLGLHPAPADVTDRASTNKLRSELVGALSRASRAETGGDDGRWPAAYGARRIAWHALDHAWEIEDRSH